MKILLYKGIVLRLYEMNVYTLSGSMSGVYDDESMNSKYK